MDRLKAANPVRVVTDGQEAIDYLRGEPPFMDRGTHPMPQLLLLDLKMPRLNGFEVLSWLKTQPGLRRLLAIVFSSSAEAGDINRAYDLGANSYLVKPHATEQLLELVTNTLHICGQLTNVSSNKEADRSR